MRPGHCVAGFSDPSLTARVSAGMLRWHRADKDITCRGLLMRVKSPSSATSVATTARAMPRRACTQPPDSALLNTMPLALLWRAGVLKRRRWMVLQDLLRLRPPVDPALSTRFHYVFLVLL